MSLLLTGLAILVLGGWAYGKFCEKQFGPDERPTPACIKADGVDYVPMKGWKNTLINLLNIAGTGPVLGPIQGILFGPVALITIPVGCVLAGAMHDYFNGMIATRNGGAQMPRIISKYLGGKAKGVYLIFSSILLMLVGVVFVYTPGDLIVNDVLRQIPSISAWVTGNAWVIWLVYGLIFLYYIVATIFPIDKIIGRIYPVFGALLMLSAVGILISIFADGGKSLHNLSSVFFTTDREGVTTVHQFAGGFIGHFRKIPFIPVFFITVACGVMSGFHGSQTALIGRTIQKEKQGRWIFFNSMLMEGLIAMAWAAGAMVLFNRAALDAAGNVLAGGAALNTNVTGMVGSISRTFLGGVGGIFAVAGVIVLPITSGDTAFRALRLQMAERFRIDQKSAAKRMGLAALLFIPAIGILIFAKSNADGFNILWRYFGWANQTLAVFALGMATVYLFVHKKNFWIAFIPALFYCFVVFSFIFHDKIGLRLDTLLGLTADNAENYTASYIMGTLVTILFGWFIRARMHNIREGLTTYDA